MTRNEALACVGKTVKLPVIARNGNPGTRTLKVFLNAATNTIYAYKELSAMSSVSSITDYAYDEVSGAFKASVYY